MPRYCRTCVESEGCSHYDAESREPCVIDITWERVSEQELKKRYEVRQVFTRKRVKARDRRVWKPNDIMAGSWDLMSLAARVRRIFDHGMCTTCPHFGVRCRGDSRLISGEPCLFRAEKELTGVSPPASAGQAMEDYAREAFAAMLDISDWPEDECGLAANVEVILSELRRCLQDPSEQRADIRANIDDWDEELYGDPPRMPRFPASPYGAEIVGRVLSALRAVAATGGWEYCDGLIPLRLNYMRLVQFGGTPGVAAANAQRLVWELGRQFAELKETKKWLKVPSELIVAFAAAVR